MNASPPPHPTDQILYDYGLGKLGDPAASAVDLHLEACPACRQRVSELSGDSFLGRLRDAGARPDTPAPGPAPSGGAKKADGPSNPAPVPSPDPDLAGSLPPELADNPQYQMLRELGRGGMGVVYLARNTLMDRLEVLKVLNKEMLERKGTYDRFLREVRAAARLAHPNVVAAYSAVQVGHLLVFAMEYVEGADLSQLVKSRGPLPVAHACSFIHQAALGLQHAHERGMVHRDIKPANLMLMRQGQRGIVKILDFGLAKASSENPIDGGLTREGQMLGTPDYIAPEQTLDAQNADIRADIYSLGCTLYYLLTGGPPFHATSLFELLQAHHSIEAKPLNLVRPEVPVELAAVVGKMMAKERERRYQTPAEVAEALKPFFKPVSGGSGSSDGERSQSRPQDANRASAGVVSPAPAPAGTVPVAAPGAAVPPNDPALMWKSLVTIPAPEHLSDARPPAPEARRRRPHWLVPSLAVGMLLLALAVAWAAGLLSLRTKDGVLVMDGVPEQAQVYVDQERIILHWPEGGGSLEVTVPAGRRGVQVKKDGFETFGEEVTVTTGARAPLHVRLVPLVSPAREPGTRDALGGVSGKKTESVTASKPQRTKSDPEATPGFIPLFNGKDLTGWKTHPSQPGNWRVENGILIGSGPQASHLYTNRGDYSNFQLRMEARINGGGNSGVCFRSSFGPFLPEHNPGFPLGYEAQINSTHQDRNKTGSLLSGAGDVLVGVAQSETFSSMWFSLEVIAERNHLIIKVNGKTTADTIDARWPTYSGHIALQQLNPSAVAEFRKIEIKELPESRLEASASAATPARPTLAIESKQITNSIDMKLVLIPAGEFLMGSPDSDTGAPNDEMPRHRVRITRPFYLGVTEVTQGQYRAVTGQSPSKFKGSDDLPVVGVSWNDAIAFCDKLSAREKGQLGGARYRLPTEAEWEYACRGGSTTRYSFGDDAARLGEFAWYKGNSDGKTHPVGQKRPNAFGLFDMLGNVLEWCSDGYQGDFYARSPVENPVCPFEGAASRVLRGGSWYDFPRDARSASRGRRAPGDRNDDLGFRAARVQSGP